jgi:YbbR domain-containing protein
LKSGNFNFNSQASIFTICLLIAILFWFITSLNKSFTRTVSIPVAYKNIPLSFQLEKPLPSKIYIDIEGKGFDLMSNDFIKKNQGVTIDFNSRVFRGINLKTHSSIATESLLNLISAKDLSYRIVKILPDSITLDYSKKFTVKVPVKLNGELSFKKQFFNFLPPLIKPDSVELAGPEELIKKITALETQKVIYNNISKNLFFSANILNPSNDKIILSEQKVWVLVAVEEFTEGKVVLPIRKIYYHNKRVTLVPEKVTITYHASLKNFSLIAEDDFEAGIDHPVQSIDNNENKLSVKVIKFPKAAQIVSVQPELADYLIEK